ncbi:myocardial zonula adherens protein isoform X1 [Anguilla rostrata]|uniref:myocardial zonula adherens protein isoform X1 n=1 Tax=Anguilla rostrata TaxID=7938 RepID=UPI0030D170A3
MLRYGSRGTVTDTQDLSSQRHIRRLRLTLTDTSSGQDGSRKVSAYAVDKVVNGSQRRKNGYVLQERSVGAEPSAQVGGLAVNVLQQNAAVVTNGVRETPTENGPKVYGVVQRTGADHQQEVMAYEWPVNHLRDEMRYIKEVRESLEKVREKMSGQFGGMQQSMQRLSQDIRVAYEQRRHLESEVRTRTAAMDSFDQMNSSLISSHIELQKSLLDSCSNRVLTQEEMRSLRSSREQAEAKVKQLEHQLATAHAENSTLKLQVESTLEVSSKKLQEMTQRLQNQYQEQLKEEKRRHMEEIRALQAQISEYVRQLEEAEQNARIAEAKIAERDQRISEVERLLDCMGKEKEQLQQKLQDCELRLRRLDQTDQIDAATIKRTKQLEDEALDLRERIKHLNDMVFSHQKKVKGMIKEIDALRAKLAQKDMYITDLLDRIAIVQCENNELEDKLKYFMSEQNNAEESTSTRDIGVGCALPLRTEFGTETAAPFLSNPARPRPVPPSRVESSVLKYSPNQYSSLLQPRSIQLDTEVTSPTQSTPTCVTLVQSGPAQSYSVQTSLELSHPEGPPPVHSYPRARTHPNKVYTPYMRLMEITANIKIE